MAPTVAATSAPEKLSNGRVVSYALGDVANNLAFQMTSMFLMVYMTDIAGIPAALAGTIYAVTKVWAGVADLIAGNTVDKANTRWGRLRPWIMWGAAPLAVALVLLFSGTALGIGRGTTAIFVYVLLVDSLFQLCYSFVNIPYGSLSAAMTQDSVDRSRLSGARSIASAVTGVALSAVISPQFQGIGKLMDNDPAGVQTKFMVTCAALGALAIVFYLICFANTREVVPRSPGKVKLSNTLRTVAQNKPLLTLCLGAFFLLGAMFTMNSVAMYYTRSVVGGAQFFTFLMLAQTVGTIAAASFVPAITVKLGKPKGYVIFAVIAVVGYVLAAVVPQGGLIVAIIAWLVFGVGSGGTNALMFAMQADTVDYGEWKTGTRSEGGSYSILSMVRKMGQGLGGAVGGAVIAAYGYNGKAAEQSAQAVDGLRVATGWVPAALGIVAALVIWFYPLTAAKHKAIVTELNERRLARTAPEVAAAAPQAGAPAAGRPVVTFFEQYGAGAEPIARKVAERLGVEYVAQILSSDQLERAESALVGAGADSGVTRFLRSFSGAGTSDADLAADAADLEADRNLAHDNAVTVMESVVNGGVVVGRNATFVLHDHPSALHVRLIAPVETRVARAAEQFGISPDVARARQEREDRVRAEMSARLFNWNPHDDSFYDVILNTAHYSVDEAVEVILNAAKIRAHR